MLRLLPCEARRGILILSAFLDLMKVPAGPSHHSILQEWIDCGWTGEADLKHFVFGRFGRESRCLRGWERALGMWRDRDAAGQWVAVWTGEGPPTPGEVACPRVIFGWGVLDEGSPWVALFNSRKPRIVTGEEGWLAALRRVLPAMEAMGCGFASSRGTATYDVVTGYAARAGCRTLLVEPALSSGGGGRNQACEGSAGGFPTLTVSCTGAGCRCPKTVRPVCRDRLLAFVADLHCLLEIRRGGNLQRILEAQQKKEAKPLVVVRPSVQGPGNEGTERILKDFPGRGVVFELEDLPQGVPAPRKPRAASTTVVEVTGVDWSRYLYHYTRGCPGPWPGQSHPEYIEDLLDGGPPSARGALDTLVRIVTERRLRAGSRLVRGEATVISWTSRPPLELGALRLWSPGLIRWTFEPYGLAVGKKALRERGAKPVIYARSAAHQRLRPEDRYRFQKHEPPRCSWKHEREWRIREDLLLKDLAPVDWFLIVPDDEARYELTCRCQGFLPVLALSDVNGGLSGE